MKKTKRLSLFLLLVTLLFNFFAPACSIAFDSSSEPPRNSVTPYVPPEGEIFEEDRVYVVIKEEYSEVNKPWYPEDFHLDGIGIAEIIDTTYCEDPSRYSSWPYSTQKLRLILSAPSKENVIEAIHQIETLYFVKFAEPEFILFGADDNSYTPNDTGFSSQWGLNNTEGISIEEAWYFTTGDTSPRIRVGIFENGVQRNHPDLRIVGGPYTPLDPVDDEHGTHVAGIIGAISNNGLGISGIAQVEIVLLNKNNFVHDVQWAIENNIKVINASFYFQLYPGSSTPAGPKSSHADILKDFSDAGGIFIASAGNASNDTDTSPQYPAGYADKRKYPTLDNVISVGAINRNAERWDSSNFGKNSVSIYAPGEEIYSTLPDNTYDYRSGTSMAAPHVTGVAALLLSYKPDLTAIQMKNAILHGADEIDIEVLLDSNNDGLLDIQSVKKLNAMKALQYVMDNYGNKTTLKYNNTTLTDTINANSTYFEESNYMLKMDVQNAYTYSFTLSSTSALNITLYDENLNKLTVSTTSTNGGCQIDFSKYLSLGKYYLLASYVSDTATGTINLTIRGFAHTHLYNNSYAMHNIRSHKAYCACGEYQLKPHVVRVGVNGPENNCILCGALVPNSGGLTLNSSQVRYVTANGSFIDSNGIIYLVEEDIDAYFAGTLIFFLKENSPVVSKSAPSYKEELFIS